MSFGWHHSNCLFQWIEPSFNIGIILFCRKWFWISDKKVYFCVTMKILLVEDDNNLRDVITRFLTRVQYVVEVAHNHQTAMQKLNDYDYDCVLLDILLPDGSGLDLLRHLKALGKRENVLIISAKDSVEDKVEGLDLGADDYLAKPFHLSELHARLRSVVRRHQYGGDNSITLGNVTLSPTDRMVTVQGSKLELLRKEYDILSYFMSRPGRLVSKMSLAEAVWGDHIDQVDNYDFLYAQMRNLRKNLKSAGADIEIKAVYGMGYKLTTDETG